MYFSCEARGFRRGRNIRLAFACRYWYPRTDVLGESQPSLAGLVWLRTDTQHSVLG
jgi:hypothetical protein